MLKVHFFVVDPFQHMFEHVTRQPAPDCLIVVQLPSIIIDFFHTRPHDDEFRYVFSPLLKY